MRCREFEGTPDWCTEQANDEGYGWCDRHQLYHYIFAQEQRAKRLGMPVSDFIAREWLVGPIDDKPE
jgi:hypothetical protein